MIKMEFETEEGYVESRTTTRRRGLLIRRAGGGGVL